MGAAEEKLRPLAHRSRSEAQISEEEKIYLKAYLTAETVENIQGKTKIPLKQIILKFCFQIKNIRKTIATNRIHQTWTFLYYDNVCSRSLISLVLQSFLWLGGANVHGAHGWGGGVTLTVGAMTGECKNKLALTRSRCLQYKSLQFWFIMVSLYE